MFLLFHSAPHPVFRPLGGTGCGVSGKSLPCPSKRGEKRKRDDYLILCQPVEEDKKSQKNPGSGLSQLAVVVRVTNG